LLWANSPAADSYHALWHSSFTIELGSFSLSRSLHFWINDALMTVFFLVVGMEIRREIHEGALSSLRLAALPLAGALGGVAVPALIYLFWNAGTEQSQGWAVPTATDIAFAIGVLALLGRSIPGSLRVFLLALAIIDDIVAVLIIALFYSGGLDYSGLLLAALGILGVLGMQHIGVGRASAYLLPGALLWWGLLQSGAHPTLAGVILGLMTPVVVGRTREPALETASRALDEFSERAMQPEASDAQQLLAPLKQLREAQRHLLPPVTRVQMALHPWVAFGVMPLFALANAGVTLGGVDLGSGGTGAVMLGVLLALLLGKPLGILGATWLALRLGGCRLPEGVSWPGLWLIGLLAGIGFTMSIFIATLAFPESPQLLGAAKLGVLLASLLAGLLGLSLGMLLARRPGRLAWAQPLG